ncbi:MAG TPA: DUF1080 domain-containing protein [Flavitalea sp.]|nr:DUF1080 domain-containing protein [Flavitalea sp.]
MKKSALMFAAAVSVTIAGMAQVDPKKQTPESTEIWEPVPKAVKPGKVFGSAPSSAPADAIVLFDGSSLDGWKSSRNGGAAPWLIEGDAITVKPGSGDIQTRQEFEDFQLHIEFRTPAKVEGDGQGRGNSGIFMQGIYELQVLDSYNNPTYSNGQAGSIYKQSMPMVNASLAPGAWQTYDVIYTAPKFNKDGMMIHPPYITVLHNGVLIQNHTAIRGTTPFVGLPQVKPHGKGPIKLQDHQNPTSFRNIWIREL